MRRAKVTTACEECRSKKKKCDGQRPICRPCRDHNFRCHWPNFSGRSNASTKKYVSQLESKVKELERGHGKADSSHQFQQVHPITPSTSDDPSPQDYGRTSTVGGTDATNFSIDDSQDHAVNSHSSKSLSSIIHDNLRGSKTTYGTASIGGFITQVVQTIDKQYQPSEEVQPFGQVGVTGKMTASHVTDPLGLGHALPSRKTADALLDIYWKYHYTIFPFVDRNEIETAYRNLWVADRNETEEPVLIFILDVMFALAALISPTIAPDQRAAAAEVFLARAQQAFTLDLWNEGTFQSVQALLLLGQYYHTNNTPQAWKAVGMAVRSAQCLGLHLPETSEQMPSAEAREFARRVWHGCVMMDRILSQTYGRPSIVSKKVAAAVPFPSSMGQLSPSEPNSMIDNSKPTPSPIDFFAQSLIMYELLADIISHYYSDPSNRAKGNSEDYEIFFARPSERSLLSFEHSFTEWFENLPPHLRVSTAYSYGEIFSRQAVIVQQRLNPPPCRYKSEEAKLDRYLHIRIILLRPTLRSVLATFDSQHEQIKTFKTKQLHHEITLQCAVTCVETAQEAINTIKVNGPSNVAEVGIVSAWVHNILFLYTAAIILVTARLCPPITFHISEESITSSWNDVVELLQKYEAYGPSAKRAGAILDTLNQQINSKQARKEDNTQLVDNTNVTSNDVQFAAPYLNDESDDVLQSFPEVQMEDVPFGLLDLSPFNLEDFSWMDSIPFNM